MSQAQVNSHLQLPFPKSHAFIVGIYDYEYVSKLTSAISDVRCAMYAVGQANVPDRKTNQDAAPR